MPPYDPTSRDDIAQLLAEQRNLAGNPLASSMAGLGAGYGGASPMTGPTLQGLPQTPAGGVPGAGIGPGGPSVLPTPPPQVSGGALPGMGSLGAGMGAVGGMPSPPPQPLPTMSMPPPPPRPGMLGDLGGTGQMSDFQTPGRMGRRRGY